MTSSPHATGDIYCVARDTLLWKLGPNDGPQKGVTNHQPLELHTWAVFGNVCVDKAALLLEDRKQREVQQTISGFTVHTDHIYLVIAHYFLCSLEPQGQCICFQREMGSWDIGSIPMLLFLIHIPAKLFLHPKLRLPWVRALTRQ